MNYFIQLLINGLALGSIYALTAIGYSMVYSILELVNFAHGSVYMAGAFGYYILVVMLGWPWYISLAAILLFVGLLGIGYEKATLLPLRKANLPKFTGLISTMGVSIILQNVLFLSMGSTTHLYPSFFEGEFFTVGPFTVTYIQVLIIVLSATLLIALSLFIKKTKVGIAMRAVSQNTDASEWMGINVNRIVSLTFFLGSVFAALSGILSCMSFRGVDISVGVKIAIKAFGATVIGGIGNLSGAALGAFIIAEAETLTAGYVSSDMRDLVAFVILILILTIKTDGLLGKKVQKKV